MSSPVKAVAAGDNEELLLGIPYDSQVTWRVVVENAAGSDTSPDQAIGTRAVPSSLPLPVVLSSDPARYDPDVEYVYLSVAQEGGDAGDPWWTLIVDRQGRVVWGKQSDPSRTSFHPRVSWDGTALLVDQNAFWAIFSLSQGSVDKIKIDGSIVHTWQTPGLHHPLQELPDGSLAYGGFTGWYDEVLQIVHPDGTADALWSCDDFMSSIGESTSCASNTLNYDLLTDTFLFSFWTSETVIQVDGTTGDTLRWFGHSAGAYAFDPPNSAFWYQHGAHLTPQGTFLVSTHASEPSVELVTREYEIDDTNHTLHEIWNAGLGDGVTGSQMGEAYRFPGGNTLQNYGYNPRMREFTPEGDVVWDVDFPTTSRIGRSTGLSDLYLLAP
jgi:hypothetical protein